MRTITNRSFSVDKEDFRKDDTVLHFLKKEADYIILAGFLWKIPEKIVAAFPNKIINIHPCSIAKIWWKRDVRNACSQSGKRT